jgi:hypothetical protein
LFHSTDNGKTLTPKRKTIWWEESGWIFGDSVPGRLFQLPIGSNDTFGVSFDYGVSFEKKFFNDMNTYAAGCMEGEIYISGWGLYRGTDYGDTFTFQSAHDSLDLREVGTLPGELYWFKLSTGPPLRLAYSNDYGVTYSLSFIDFPGIPLYDECMIYRGTEPGELYFVVWVSWVEILLFHTFDYGQTVTFQNQLPSAMNDDLFTAGRTPGTFYHVQREICGTPPSFLYSCLHIHFSRDFGVTFNEYFHFLDSTYTGLPSKPPAVKDFHIYPNPVGEKLTIEFQNPSSGAEIELLDITGKTVINRRILPASGVMEMNTEFLNPGMYFVKAILPGNRQVVEKIVVE